VHAVDEHRPADARDVPIELVERADIARREEESDRVGDAVPNDNGAIRVGRAGNENVVASRPARIESLVLDDECAAGAVGDVAVFDVEPGLPAVSGLMVE
jgi:hypothetical protein